MRRTVAGLFALALAVFHFGAVAALLFALGVMVALIVVLALPPIV